MTHSITISGIETLPYAAREFLSVTGINRKFAFSGEMGAGKTTLIKAICLQLGVEEYITSPTFSIVNEYITKDKQHIYHIDLYRMQSETEVMDAGCEDYFYGDNYCFVEWPEKALTLLPENFILVKLKITANDKRIVTIDIK